jgi:Family of unknown function (DUF6062)
MASRQAAFRNRSHWFTEMSLADSLRVGECLICSNLIYSERRAIHSFLWEGMMSSLAREEFLKGGGFCPRHFWIAKGIENEGSPASGIGVAILCENLVALAIAESPRDMTLEHREPVNPFRRKRDVDMPPPGSGCMFCRDRIEREESLIATLEDLKRRPIWSEKLEQSPLCVYHARLALAIWKDSEQKQLIRSALEARLKELQADLNEFIRKHDWNHRNEPLAREKDAVERAIQSLSGLEGQFPLTKTGSEGGRNHGSGER